MNEQDKLTDLMKACEWALAVFLYEQHALRHCGLREDAIEKLDAACRKARGLGD